MAQERLLHSPLIKLIALWPFHPEDVFCPFSITLELPVLGVASSFDLNSRFSVIFFIFIFFPELWWLDNAADGPEILICRLLSRISWLTNCDGSQKTSVLPWTKMRPTDFFHVFFFLRGGGVGQYFSTVHLLCCKFNTSWFGWGDKNHQVWAVKADLDTRRTLGMSPPPLWCEQQTTS